GHRLSVDLGGDDVLLAHPEEPLEQAPGDDLALAAVVDVRGVKERDPALHGAPNDRLGRRLVERPGAALVLTEPHHAETKARAAQAGLPEVHVHHVTLPWSSVFGSGRILPDASRHSTGFLPCAMIPPPADRHRQR